jgi:hypothetical protein
VCLSVCGSVWVILFQGWIQLSPRCCIESIPVQPMWAPAARPSTLPTTVHLLHDQALCSSRAVHLRLTTTDIADYRVWTATQKIRSNRCKNSSLPTVVCLLNCQVLPSSKTVHLPPPKISITDSGQLLRVSELTTAKLSSLPTNTHLLHFKNCLYTMTGIT